MISSSAWLHLGAVCLAVGDGPVDIPPSQAQTSLLGVRTQSKARSCCGTGRWWGGHQLEQPLQRRKPVSCSEQCQREGKGQVLALGSSLPAESAIKAHKAAHPKAGYWLHFCVWGYFCYTSSEGTWWAAKGGAALE